jgi:hypothetical protein
MRNDSPRHSPRERQDRLDPGGAQKHLKRINLSEGRTDQNRALSSVTDRVKGNYWMSFSNAGTPRSQSSLIDSDVLGCSVHSAAVCLSREGCMDTSISNNPSRAELHHSPCHSQGFIEFHSIQKEVILDRRPLSRSGNRSHGSAFEWCVVHFRKWLQLIISLKDLAASRPHSSQLFARHARPSRSGPVGSAHLRYRPNPLRWSAEITLTVN